MNNSIIRDELHELIDFTTKYSPEQLAKMLCHLDIDMLHKDMTERGATREELRSVSELYHDVTTVYGVI